MTYPKTTIQISPSKLENIIWATTAIGLGAWETTALTTKRIPTISRTCRSARQQHRRSTELAVITWLFGLGLHLLRQVSDQ